MKVTANALEMPLKMDPLVPSAAGPRASFCITKAMPSPLVPLAPGPVTEKLKTTRHASAGTGSFRNAEPTRLSTESVSWMGSESSFDTNAAPEPEIFHADGEPVAVVVGVGVEPKLFDAVAVAVAV